MESEKCFHCQNDLKLCLILELDLSQGLHSTSQKYLSIKWNLIRIGSRVHGIVTIGCMQNTARECRGSRAYWFLEEVRVYGRLAYLQVFFPVRDYGGDVSKKLHCCCWNLFWNLRPHTPETPDTLYTRFCMQSLFHEHKLIKSQSFLQLVLVPHRML